MDKLDAESPAAVVLNEEAVKSPSSNEFKSILTSVWSRSLRVVPKFTVADVEKLIKTKCKTSTVSKGYKFFTEGYIHNIECRAENIGTNAGSKCDVRARCWRSMRKNERPHKLKLVLHKQNRGMLDIPSYICSCKAGKGFCNHLTALLYTLGHYIKLGLKAIPPPSSSTSLPQQWHKPRVRGIKPESVLNVMVKDPCKAAKEKLETKLEDAQGISSKSPNSSEKQAKKRRVGVHSTLYDPLPDNFNTDRFVTDFCSFVHDQPMPIQFSQLLPESTATMRLSDSEFGYVPRGSVLSYQCLPKLSNDFVKIFDISIFPDFPLPSYQDEVLQLNLTEDESSIIDSFAVDRDQSILIEKNTQDQSNNPEWANLRKDRLTASKDFKRIYSRRSDHAQLAEEIFATDKRLITTAAMERGIKYEPDAAKFYFDTNTVNIYKSGFVINPSIPFLGASPDYKVYDPSEPISPYGLLEIKCPSCESVYDVKFLKHLEDGSLSLNRNGEHFIQIMGQLGLTGLKWCDYLVWCENDFHLERIYFSKDLFQDILKKLQDFFYKSGLTTLAKKWLK